MGHQDLSRYRNLVDLSDEEWKDLNIYLFIAANFSRYCSPLIKKIGAKYLPSDASETLLSLSVMWATNHSSAFTAKTSIHEAKDATRSC